MIISCRYNWHNIQKKVFINRYKRSNVVEYCYQFLRELESIKSYLVEFEKNGSMKLKVYLDNCSVGGSNCYFIISIMHDESTFNTNNGC